MKALRFCMSSIIAFTCAIGFTACLKKPKSESALESQRQTAIVDRQNLDFAVEVIGELSPSLQVEVKAEVSGKVKSIRKTLGESVKAGDLVVELDDTELITKKSSAETEIEGAKLALRKVVMEAERNQQLVDADLISKKEADNSQLDAEIARNNLDKVMKALQSVEDLLLKTRILAPIDGTVIEEPIVERQVVIGGPSAATGTLLMKLAKLDEMLISTHINQIDVTRMEVGQLVNVTVDAFEGIRLQGKIVFIAPVAILKNNIKGFPVAILVASSDPRMRPGMSANVKIPISKAASVLAVPIEAIFREGKKRMVYLQKNSTFSPNEVEIGLVTSDRVEIKSGLKEGDVVALSRPKMEEKKIEFKK